MMPNTVPGRPGGPRGMTTSPSTSSTSSSTPGLRVGAFGEFFLVSRKSSPDDGPTIRPETDVGSETS